MRRAAIDECQMVRHKPAPLGAEKDGALLHFPASATFEGAFDNVNNRAT